MNNQSPVITPTQTSSAPTASVLVHPEELSHVWIDRCAAYGIPTIGLHPVGGQAAADTMASLLCMMEDDTFCALLSYAEERGIAIEYEMHAMRYFLPSSEFSRHPEWFRENEAGERVPDLNCCVSSTEALDYIAVRAADAARRLAKPLSHPTHRYFFWMDDARGGFCHCEKCRRLSPSDQQLLVMNRILKEIRRDDKNAALAYLAYCECTEPPKTVKPDDGIFLEFAPFDRDFHTPLTAADCEKNSASTAPLSALLSLFGTDDAKVLEYWLDNSLYSGWKKPPKAFCEDKAVVHADFAYYKALGFTDISTFACYLGADYEALYGDADIRAFAEEVNALLLMPQHTSAVN
ncbi:MAG: DUF4838 domain-containing protein [Clostridia bacterium]|nr:DUF4838 domain-containing protein [Clostridia bacterium]